MSGDGGRGICGELPLELAHFLGTVAERHRRLPRHAAGRSGGDDRDRALRLDHRAGNWIGRRRIAHLAVEDGGADWLSLCRVFPQYPAAGATVPVVFRAAGTGPAIMGSLAEAIAPCTVLHRNDRYRIVHVG